MRIAHTADWHGGFRQFDRSEHGQNVREQDVARAIAAAVDGILAAHPDLILLAGDIHHSVRPPNGAVLRTFAQLQRLRAALPQAPIILVAGDHDSPRSSDVGSILPLFRALGVHIVEGSEPQVIDVGPCIVTAVPKWACRRMPPAPADGRLHVAIAHGEARSVGGIEPELDAAAFAGYAYVALGHWHVCQCMAPNAWYSGSLCYTSTDPWGELREQARRGLPSKGWLLLDLVDGAAPTVTFQPIEPPRRYLELAPINAQGLGAGELDAAIAARVGEIELDGAVVRLIVEDVSREVRHALDYKRIRAYKAAALHFQLECRRPEAETTPTARAQRRQTLDQLVDAFLGARELAPDVDRAELRRLAAEYMTKAAGTDDPYTELPAAPAQAAG